MKIRVKNRELSGWKGGWLMSGWKGGWLMGGWKGGWLMSGWKGGWLMSGWKGGWLKGKLNDSLVEKLLGQQECSPGWPGGWQHLAGGSG